MTNRELFRLPAVLFFTLTICLLALADMNPLHEPGSRFTHVLGVDLMADTLVQIHGKLGRSPASSTGDASEYVAKTCYLLGDGATTIEFNEWELGTGCVVRKRKRGDSAACAPLERQKASEHVEINGLKLGISRSEVLKILGEPTTKAPNQWTYDFHGHAKDYSGGGASRFGKGQDYFWQLLIKVSFEDSVVSRIEVSPSVQS
ncbi:MAG: hypothetical protein ACLP1Y_05455 [Candidatus Acidiferrales bacterium]